MKPTKHHQPIAWHAILGTLTACSPNKIPKYMDYDREAAKRYSEIGRYIDLRYWKKTQYYTLTNDPGDYGENEPRFGQWILWGILKEEK